MCCDMRWMKHSIRCVLGLASEPDDTPQLQRPARNRLLGALACHHIRFHFRLLFSPECAPAVSPI